LLDCSAGELAGLVRRAIEMKTAMKAAGAAGPSIAKNKVLAMIFEKSSTRTRVSFEAGMAQLGGQAIFLSPADTQIGRGEPVADSARVISSMVDLIMVRTYAHRDLEEFAAHSAVPVINALTDEFHPCQLLADMQTFAEERGGIAGKAVAWVGDGNNMCNSYINAACQWDFELRIACPRGFAPNAELLAANSGRVRLGHSPAEAVAGASLVVTDTWASMGKEAEKAARIEAFAGFQVDLELMARAAADAIFLHCLPACRGREVSAELLEDGRYSRVFAAAENRLHAQKALIEFLLG